MRLSSAFAVCLWFFATFASPFETTGWLGVTPSEAQVRGVGRAGVRPGVGPAIRPGRPVARPVPRRPVVAAPGRRGRPIVFAPVRPVPVVRPWYWGRVVAGVAVGSIIAVSVAGAVPKAPSSTLCWFWTDDNQTRGYWDYCVPPAQ